MIDLSTLRYFIAVAETGSFTQAALQFGMSRPVITKSIRRLEDQVGKYLFERTMRSATLTAAGEVLLAEARAAVQGIAIATHKARRISDEQRATLRIGLCWSAVPAKQHIGRAFDALRADWPDIDIPFTSCKRNLQSQALRSGEIDVGFMVLNRSDCDGLTWRTLARAPLMVWIPPSWGFTNPVIRLEELRNRPWILASPTLSPDLHALQMSLCRGVGFEPRLAAYFEDPVVGRMMRACEQGAAFIHKWDTWAEDPAAKEIFGVSPFFSCELVVAWATDAASRHIDDLVAHLLSTSAE